MTTARTRSLEPQHISQTHAVALANSVRLPIMPDAVKVALIFCYFLLAVFMVPALTGFSALLHRDYESAVFWSPSAVFVAFFLFFTRELRHRSKLAWELQAMLSIVGLLCLLTLVNIGLLIAWVKPDVKAWFSEP